MQHRRSCQNTCSIRLYVVSTAVCTHVLYTLIVTVQVSYLSIQGTPHTHTHTHTTQSQMLSSGSPTKNIKEPYMGMGQIPLYTVWKTLK